MVLKFQFDLECLNHLEFKIIIWILSKFVIKQYSFALISIK